MRCKCGEEIPQKRIDLGFKECVKCSTVEMVGCIDIVYHKTGNTIEIVDIETAKRMRKLSQRSSFGTLRGLKTSKRDNSILTGSAPIEDKMAFEKAGLMAMDLYESKGEEYAIVWLERRVNDFTITQFQANRIMDLIKAMDRPIEIPKVLKPNRYGKYEPKKIKPEISDEISQMFRMWKIQTK